METKVEKFWFRYEIDFGSTNYLLKLKWYHVVVTCSFYNTGNYAKMQRSKIEQLMISKQLILLLVVG